MGVPMADVLRTCHPGNSNEQKLFGRFFSDVDGCREHMKQKQVLASGSAVLHALLDDPTWVPSDLDLFVLRTSLGERGLLEWREYFESEGYEVSRSRGGTLYPNVEVSVDNFII